jgi:hypothetical protein
MPLDLERAFNGLGKLRNGVIDPLRLPGKGIEHVLGRFRPPADQLHGGKHEGNVVVHVMAQVGKLLLQLADLLDA